MTSSNDTLTGRVTQVHGGIAEEALRAAIGPNSDYYLARWSEIRAKGSRVSWNWAACLANLYWLAWRKMWAPLTLLVVAFVLVWIVGALLPALAQATLLISIGFTFVTGAYGNEIYRRHCERLVAGTAGLEGEEALAGLRRRGGTSATALAVTIAATLLLIGLPIGLQISAP